MDKKTKKCDKAKKMKNMNAKTSLSVIFIIALEIVYFYHFLTQGLLVHYGYDVEKLTSLAQPLILLFLFIMTAVSLIIIVYGVMLLKPWTKKFTMYFVLWASIWPIWGLLVGNQPLIQVIMLAIHLSVFFYLLSSYIKDIYGEKEVLRYGKYSPDKK